MLSLFSNMTLIWRDWCHFDKSSINILSLICFARNAFLFATHISCTVWFMVFNATFNLVISWRSEETGVPGENHRPVASHWQTLSRNVVSSTPRQLTTLVMICTDYTGSYKSNYHETTTMAALPLLSIVHC